MSKPFLRVLFTTLLLACAPAAHAAKTSASDWELVEEKDGIRVWEKEIPGSDIRACRAETVMEVSPGRIWEVLNNRQDYPKFMPYIEEVRLLERDRRTAIVYQRVDPPLVSERDYTIRVEADIAPEERRYERCWEIANEHGPDEHEDMVRIRTSNGCWELTGLSEEQTRVRYHVHTDPGGSVPSWIANMANSNGVPKLLRAVENRAQDPDWTP